MNTLRLIVAGSRTATSYEQTETAIINWHIDHKHAGNKLVIISGNAKGPDSHGIVFAKQYGHQVEIYPAEWDKYGKSAGYRRNAVMASTATHLLAIWDGQSKGTKHMIDIARKLNIPVRIINSNNYLEEINIISM